MTHTLYDTAHYVFPASYIQIPPWPIYDFPLRMRNQTSLSRKKKSEFLHFRVTGYSGSKRELNT